MKIVVKAKPGARKEAVERLTQPTLGLVGSNEPVTYKVSVKEPATGGLANDAIAQALARYFEISASRIRLVTGGKSKQKIFEIL